MGEKMNQLYDFVQKTGGVEAKMRLAVVTGISSLKAKTEPDTPENIAKLKDGIKAITGKDAPSV
jgi:hypothetical protein